MEAVGEMLVVKGLRMVGGVMSFGSVISQG